MSTPCSNFKTTRREVNRLYKELIGTLKEAGKDQSSEARDRADILLDALEKKLIALKKEFAEYFDLFVEVLQRSEHTAERLEKLKQTNLWDKANELWIHSMDRNGHEGNTSRYTKDQFLYTRLLIALGEEDKARIHFEKLKQTNLWDKKNGQWVQYILETGAVGNINRSAGIQLSYLHTLIALGEEDKARIHFEKLKQTNLWDKQEKLWINNIRKNGSEGDTDCFTGDQLSHLRLLVALGKEEVAKTYLAKLKTDFWDEEEGLWAWGMNRHSGETYTRRYTNDQLSYLRLLIALGKKEEAKAHLAKFKQTSLWDEEEELWIQRIQKDSNGGINVYSTNDQLSYLRLLIALGKKEEAKAHLAKLKQTNLWNKENQLWIWLIQKDGTEVGVHSVEDQLLGALVEGLME